MEAISVINLMPSTSSEVSKMFLILKQEILSGNENPLKIEVQLKGIEDLIKKLRGDAEIKDQMILEGNKYPEKSFEIYGAKFSKTTVGVKFDFTECGDSEWVQLANNLSISKLKLKEKEGFLKTLKKQIANPENGELINPPIKTGKESISVKLL